MCDARRAAADGIALRPLRAGGDDENERSVSDREGGRGEHRDNAPDAQNDLFNACADALVIASWFAARAQVMG